MLAFGLLLFIGGSALVLWASFIGVDVRGITDADMVGRLRVMAFAVLGGGSMMVSGAVFAVGGYLRELGERQNRLLDDGFEDLRVLIGYSMEKVPDVVEREKRRLLFGSAKTFTFMGKSFPTKEVAENARAEFIRRYGRA